MTSTNCPKKPHRKKSPLPDFQAEDFFVLRSPLLPFDEYARLLAPDDDGGGDEAELRRRLMAWAHRPEIAEALFVASPSLMEGLERAEQRTADGKKPSKSAAKKIRRLRDSLTRYALRIMTRSTPFGLFAGGSLGTVGERTELRLGERSANGRHTRLDMDYLYRLARDLERDRSVRPHLTYFPNSSLYRSAGRLRYAEGRHGTERRTYHLVAARSDEFLDAALEAARSGAYLDTLASAVAACDPDGEIELDEAREFVHELIDAQILVSDLGPRVTGPEPVHDLVERLSGIEKTEPVAACLAEVRQRLDRLDNGTGASSDAYRQIAERLEPLGTEVRLPRLFQVDMTKPGHELRLGPDVVHEVERAMAFLYRLRGALANDPFQNFRDDFLRRYEASRGVPLVEVLDEEVGIGFHRSGGVGSEHAPLLQGLSLRRRGGPWEVQWSGAQHLVTRKLLDALARGESEVVWTDDDLADVDEDALRPLPDALQAFFTVTAPSSEAIDDGDFRILFKSATGPSGATLLGRFCHGDEALGERVAEHLRREEAHWNPNDENDTIFAEVVHLPEGRIGNILLRPVLRDYEIPFLGHSGCAEERQIPITDLMVSVVGDEVVLWSKKLRKRILPRLTTAHNFSLRGSGMYRFLCSLQHQGLCAGLAWSWGPLDQMPHLPRVVYGRTVLSAAEWRVEKKELDRFVSLEGDARARKIDAWRRERKIPERVLLADGDNELFVDFGNPLAVDAFTSTVKDRPSVRLLELLQDAPHLPLRGPDGAYTHEILLPFVRKVTDRPKMKTPKRLDFLPQVTPDQVPAYVPGSEWIYAKLYTGTSTADDLLTGPIPELLNRYGREIDSWFFLRYGDPDFHLRARFRVPDPDLRLDFQRRLSHVASALLAEGKIWDLRLETYRPEIERYGGAHGLPLCERIFDADSRAIVDMLPVLRGDAGSELRWAAALASVDRLLTDLFADDLDGHVRCLDNVKQGFAREFGVDGAVRKQLSTRMREKQPLIEAALGGSSVEGPLGHALRVLDERSERIREPTAELRRAHAEDRLTMSLIGLGGSLAHMTVNRLIPAEARAHEAVLYDFLHRHAMSRRARRRAAAEV